MGAQRVVPTSLAEPSGAYRRVVEEIEQSIVSGALKAGQHIPSERVLAEHLGVARSTVREALRVLENMDLISIRQGDPRGPTVLPVSLAPVQRSIVRLSAAKELSLAELVQFRMVIDSSASVLAANRRTHADLVRLERNMARMREGMPMDYKAFSRIDLEFHAIIAEISGHKMLRGMSEVMSEVVLDLIQRTIIESDNTETLMMRTLRVHGEVFDAIRTQDGHRASVLSREGLYDYYSAHVDEGERRLLGALVDEVAGGSR